MTDDFEAEIDDYSGDSSSSGSDGEDEQKSSSSAKNEGFFVKKEQLHALLGGGNAADIVLWRNKRISSGILASATVAWFLAEFSGYNLLTLTSAGLWFSLLLFFVWSKLSPNKTPSELPEIVLPEDLFLDLARILHYGINQASYVFWHIVSRKDWMEFAMVVAVLWMFSVVGSWFDFLTFFYTVFVLLFTLPVIYEKYEKHVDGVADRAIINILRHSATIDKRLLQKIPRHFSLSKKKQ